MGIRGRGSKVGRRGMLVSAIFLLAVACSSSEPQARPDDAPQASPTSGYDLSLSVLSVGRAEVNAPVAIRFRVANAGPDEALSIMTMQDVFKDLSADVDVWVGPGGGGRLVSFDQGPLPGGEEASRNAILRFPTPTAAQVEIFVAPDEPQDRNPSDNQVTFEVNVTSPACTERARDGITNTRRRQVICTRNGGDTLSAGDQDVVRSGGGNDRVTCVQSFCVLELGGGNDVARCRGACYVDGGPGKDSCPRGPSIISVNCER